MRLQSLARTLSLLLVGHRVDHATLRERVHRLEAELAQAPEGAARTRELEGQLAWARSELTRFEDARSRRQRRWLGRAVMALVMVGVGLAITRAVKLGRDAEDTPAPWRWPFTDPPDLESIAAADLRCPREQLSVGHFGTHQRIVTGRGRCAHYAYGVGMWAFGPSRVLDPETLKYTCNAVP